MVQGMDSYFSVPPSSVKAQFSYSGNVLNKNLYKIINSIFLLKKYEFILWNKDKICIYSNSSLWRRLSILSADEVIVLYVGRGCLDGQVHVARALKTVNLKAHSKSNVSPGS